MKLVTIFSALFLSACASQVHDFDVIAADRVGRTTYAYAGWITLVERDGRWAATNNVLDSSAVVFFLDADRRRIQAHHDLGDRLFVRALIRSEVICVSGNCARVPSEGYYFHNLRIFQVARD